MYSKMHVIYCYFERVEQIKLECGGGGGGWPIIPTLLSIQVYYYVIAMCTNICTLYYIFLYVYIISLDII